MTKLFDAPREMTEKHVLVVKTVLNLAFHHGNSLNSQSWGSVLDMISRLDFLRLINNGLKNPNDAYFR